MPVIPGTQEGQVLNAGSPVPIAAPEEARAFGNATSQLGSGAFALGDALDKVATAAKARKDTLTAQLALQQAREVTQQMMAQHEQAAPVPNDPTGYGQVQSFRDSVREPLNDIINQVEDPETRRATQALVYDNVNDTAKEVYAKEVVKRVENNKVLEARVISEAAGSARANPKNIFPAMATAEMAILTNNDIPGSVKQIRIADAKKQILQDAIEGEISKGADANYANAEIILEKYGNGVFDVKEKAKVLDDIRNTQTRQYNQEYTRLTRDEKRQEKFRQDVEKQMTEYYSVALQQAGNDESKRAPILQQIGLDMASGKISSTKGDALMGIKTFGIVADARYSAKTLADVFKTDAYGEAADQVLKDMGTKVSSPAAEQLISRLKALEERKRNDPKLTQAIKDGERLIRDQASDSITQVMSTLDKRKLLTQVDLAVQEYHKQVLGDSKVDPIALSRKITNEWLKGDAYPLKNFDGYMNVSTVEGIEKEKARIVGEAMRKQQKGLMNVKEQEDVKQNLRNLEIIKKKLEINKPPADAVQTQSTGAAPSVGKTPAVRGK